ncbi:MAG: TIGR01212 family radical SAM protein [Clostridiales bacterium]|nr:TIGR01212 family radical SAM protein [Clostridiales bacterium]
MSYNKLQDPKNSIPQIWHSKRYYSLDAYFKNAFGQKLKKIAIDAGFTCPNRDGSLDTRGCIFCSEGGSGEFAVPFSSIEAAGSYIAYFQSYTGTYAPVERLERIYRQALADCSVLGISIATRPDCLPEDVLVLLRKLKADYPHKFIWIELGLQTIHDQTALYIRRGYSLDCFTRAVDALHSLRIPVIVHVILGLPGENERMMLETVEHLNTLPVFGIKLQLLHVLSGTDLAVDYKNGVFSVLTMEEYLQILIKCIEHLSPNTVIHRVTGDGPKNLLIAPYWSANKQKVLNALHHRMKLQNSYQGKYWKGSISYAAGTSDTL